jgi:hypothetical protein
VVGKTKESCQARCQTRVRKLRWLLGRCVDPAHSIQHGHGKEDPVLKDTGSKSSTTIYFCGGLGGVCPDPFPLPLGFPVPWVPDAPFELPEP